MNINFNLLCLILQKASGKSRESHLNIRCWRPANRIPELCSPITGTHPQSREPFTPADPPLPTAHLVTPISRSLVAPPVPDPRSRIDRAQVASADREAAPHRQVETQRRRAGRAASARGDHRSTTTLGPQPGVLTLQPVAATPEQRTERGSCSSRLEESGPLARLTGGDARWGAVGRAALIRVCTAPWSRASRSGDRPSLHLPSPQQGSWELWWLHTSALAPAPAQACALAGDGGGLRSHLPPSAPLTWILLSIFNLL